MNAPTVKSSSSQHVATEVLSYESNAAGRRPRWVHAVATVYLFLLAVLLTLPAWGGLLFNGDAHDVMSLSICVGILLFSGASLMLIPVAAVRRRPIRRRSVWVPIIASGFLAGMLVLGGGLSLCEYLRKTTTTDGQSIVAAGLLTWSVWSIVFAIIAFSHRPESIGMKLHQALIAGSVLELLIAVPTHVIVRRRPDCCAGIWTGAGICMGGAVLLLSFGPSVFLLYYRRRNRIIGVIPGRFQAEQE